MAISVIDNLGPIGRYQIRNYCLSCLPVFVCGSIICAAFFIFYVPDHRCSVAVCDNNSNTSSWDIADFAVPMKDETYDQCHQYKVVSPEGECVLENFNLSVVETCSNYVYRTQPFKSTLVSHFNLVCDQAYLTQLLPALFYFGVLLGGLVFGQVSDLLGRSFAFKFVPTMILLCLIVAATVNNLGLVMTLLFLCSAGSSAIYQSAFVLGTELVRGKYRFWFGNLHSVAFTVGCLYTCLLAWSLNQWNHILLFLCIPVILLLPYPWLMQESILWLISKSRGRENRNLERAKELLLKATKENGIQMDEETIYKQLEREQQQLREAEQQEEKITWRIFFQNRTVLMRTLVMAYIWVISSEIYYAIGFLAGDVGLDLFVSFAVLSFIEMAGILAMTFLGDNFNRRPLLGISMLLCGIGNIVCGIAPKTGLIKVLGVCLGKACVSAAFALVYVYTIEIFPTAIRQTGLALCYTGARLGNIIVPYIILLKVYFDELPFLLIGVLAFIGGLIVWPLPETKGRSLPETIRDLNSMSGPTEPFGEKPKSNKLSKLKDSMNKISKDGTTGSQDGTTL